MGTISVIAAVSSETAGVSASQGSFGFSWTGSRTRGNYADGAAWVYAPSGTISMAEPTPAQTTDGGGLVVNGAEITPLANAAAQGYDENATGWSGARTASFPASVSAGDVVVKSKYFSGWVDDRDGVVEEWGACFVVDEIPAENSFAPAAVTWTGRSGLSPSVIDVSAWVAANCPNYDTSAHVSVPSYDDIIDNLNSFYPTLGQARDYLFYQNLTPHSSGGGRASFHNYGRYLASTYGAACLALCSSSFNTAQKVVIATKLISNGKQWYDPIVGEGMSFAADGGHWQWHIVPMAIYLHASGQTAALATLVTDIPGNFEQAFQVTADMLANDFVPHTSTTKPFTWRQRTLPTGSVSGTTISLIPSYAQDPYYGDFTGLLIKRVSDGASATVTDTPKTDGGNSLAPTYTITIDSQPTPAFAPTDVIYFETPHPLSVGEYDWAITGYGSTYNPSPSATYRSTQEWAGQLMGLTALGCFPADGATALGYLQAANAADTPAAGFDFPTSYGTFVNASGTSYPWEAEFWADYAATIFA